MLLLPKWVGFKAIKKGQYNEILPSNEKNLENFKKCFCDSKMFVYLQRFKTVADVA